MDGVKHSLTAGMDAHEGSLLTPGQLDGFGDSKTKATYKMTHEDGRESTFDVGGIDQGVFKLDKDGLKVGANGIG